MLTEQQKREYYTLAEQIFKGIHTPARVFEAFELAPEEAATIVNFWMRCDEFTQSVAHYLVIEKQKLLLEKTYKKELPKWHRRTISYGLTRIISILKQNLTSFGFQTSNEEKKI
jgi:hypothetical protein